MTRLAIPSVVEPNSDCDVGSQPFLRSSAFSLVPAMETRDLNAVGQDEPLCPGPIMHTLAGMPNQGLQATRGLKNHSRSEVCGQWQPDIVRFHGRSRGSAGFRWTTLSSQGPPKTILKPSALSHNPSFLSSLSILLTYHNNSKPDFLTTRQRSTVFLEASVPNTSRPLPPPHRRVYNISSTQPTYNLPFLNHVKTNENVGQEDS